MKARAPIPGLDGMRGIAAVVVVIWHLDQHFAIRFGIPRVLEEAGALSVRFFFALSGFLITYLLREEQAATGSVNIGKFYLRRILRIWPVYYMAMAIAFLVIPHVVRGDAFFGPRLEPATLAPFLMYLFLTPNIGEILFQRVLGLQHFWSLGVEEQFYAIWPWLMRLPRRIHPWVMVSVVVAKLATLFILVTWFPAMKRAIEFFEDFSVECMAIGALAAVVWTDKPAWCDYLRTRSWLKATVVALFAVGIAIRSVHPLALVGDVVVDAALILIVGHAAGPRWLNASWLVKLGRWSYGIYVYHLMVLICSATLLDLFLPLGWAYAVGLVVLTCGLTVVVAAASSRWLEAPFLRLKPRG